MNGTLLKSSIQQLKARISAALEIHRLSHTLDSQRDEPEGISYDMETPHWNFGTSDSRARHVRSGLAFSIIDLDWQA